MLINLRNALMAGRRLPYDAEVEFLQSTGTQYIDTGILATQAFGCEITLEDVATPNYNCFIKNVKNNDFSIGSNSGNTQSSYLRIRGALTWANNIGANKTFIIKNGIITANWAQIGTYDQTLSLGTGANSVGLFANAVGGNPAQCKIFSCKLYDANSTLVRDFIPVRVGTVGYLYDRVSGKLFGNAGTGDFVLGPDVVPVEYIESHGTEYIDTGIVATDAHGVRIDIATAQKSGTINTRIFGIQQNDVRFGFALYGTGQAGGNTAFWGWNAATPISAAIPQRFVASLNYQNDRKAIFNGTTYISSLGTLGSLTLPFYLLNANYGGAPFSGQYVIGKLYGAEVSVGSDITNRYKPIRVGTDATSWEGAMMDVLTRRIYRNAGTGAFTFGNDLKYPIPAA